MLEQDLLAKAKLGSAADPDQEVIKLAKAAAQYVAPTLQDQSPKAIAALELATIGRLEKRSATNSHRSNTPTIRHSE